jgi:hypothetical protein
MKLNKTILSTTVAALVSIAGLAASSTAASAYVACNGDDCWHTDSRVRAPGVRFEYHPDDWYFHQHWDANRHFRDYHTGRGYYKGGIWITL